MQRRLLVSACLMGVPVRYDGADNQSKVSDLLLWLQRWQQQNRLIIVCPETLGGLPTPRPAAELAGGDGYALLRQQARVITHDGQDVSEVFLEGARRCLALAQQHQAGAALLAARSPSCGNQEIYNGRFEHQLQPGAGVTVAVLETAGIRCFNPSQVTELLQWMEP